MFTILCPYFTLFSFAKLLLKLYKCNMLNNFYHFKYLERSWDLKNIKPPTKKLMVKTSQKDPVKFGCSEPSGSNTWWVSSNILSSSVQGYHMSLYLTDGSGTKAPWFIKLCWNSKILVMMTHYEDRSMECWQKGTNIRFSFMCIFWMKVKNNDWIAFWPNWDIAFCSEGV